MRVPAALDTWAAEHHSQLSPETASEVTQIAASLRSSTLAERDVRRLTHADMQALYQEFGQDQADRAALLIDVVAKWAIQREPTVPPATSEPAVRPATHASPANPTAVVQDPPGGQVPLQPAQSALSPQGIEPATVPPHASPARPELVPGTAQATAAGIPTPTYLGSDRVEEDDNRRMHGPERSWFRWALGIIGLLLVVAIAVAAWVMITRERDGVAVDATTGSPEAKSVEDAAADEAEVDGPVADTEAETAATDANAAEATPAAPTATPVPTGPVWWADTTTILSAGNQEITASTYNVSASNRAVLTGHTDGLTGVVVADDGRVITSGADMRLVDWGADVTLAQPDVINLTAPITALTRTADQTMIAGDARGNITVVSLVEQAGGPTVLQIHNSSVSAVAVVGPNRVAVGSVDGDVRIFELDQADQFIQLLHDVEVSAVVPLTTGQVVTAAVDGVIRLWDLGNVAAGPTIIAEASTPLTALIELDDGRLASADVDGVVRVLAPVADAETDLELTGHTGGVRALHDLGDGRLVSGGDDSSLRLWSLSDGNLERILDGHGDVVTGLDQLPDGRVVSISRDATGRVWDLDIDESEAVTAPHEFNIATVIPWANDQLVTGGDDGLVMLVSTSELVGPMPLIRHDAPVVGVDVTPDGTIMSVDAGSTVRLTRVDATAGEADVVASTKVGEGATALIAQGDSLFATGHVDGVIRFHDLEGENETETASIDAHEGGINDLVLLDDGRLAAAGQDRRATVIDPETLSVLAVFNGHVAPVDAVAALPDGRIASGGSDAIHVWSPDDPDGPALRLTGHRAPILSLLPLPGNRLMSTAADGRVRLWRLDDPDAEGETLVDVPGIVNPHLARAENGQFVAAAGRGYVVFSIE